MQYNTIVVSNSKIKRAVVSVPILGYLTRLVSDSVRLPKLYDHLLRDQETLNDKVLKGEYKTREAISSLNDRELELSRSVETLQKVVDNLNGTINLLDEGQLKSSKSDSKNAPGSKELFADDHVMDSFYENFEDQFRGSEETIIKRVEEYLPYFRESKIDFKKTPVLDIGSGRGEFLQLLKNNKIEAVGLDINVSMVKRSEAKSFKVIESDALSYLLTVKPQSYGVITGFHIVEHIPFNLLMRIFKSSHRALTQGGFVIFETPNPENIIVASSGFYTDPSHLNPLPPDLLAFALETCGFRDVKIDRLHPVKTTPEQVSGLPKDVSNRFYGPRDYAVIGYK